jgi:hypothetical protein
MARNRIKKQPTNKKEEKRAEIQLDLVKEIEIPIKQIELEVVNPDFMSIEGNSLSSTHNLNNKSFDISGGIYFEIHRGNIFNYFSSALIAPAKYYQRRAFDDLQSLASDFLLLANGSSVDLDDNIILIQLSLTDEELKSVKIEGSIGYFDLPIPITRVIKIITANEKIKKSIINDAILFSGGFIPESLFYISQTPRHYFLTKTELVKKDALDLRIKTKRFDRILGLFAFLRNYSLLVADKTKPYKSLPDHFFYAMQAIDNKFGNEIVQRHSIHEFYSFLFNENTPEDKQLLKWIFNRITVDDNFHDDDIYEFEKVFLLTKDESMSTEQVKHIFNSLKQNLERKGVLSIIEISKSRSMLPLYIFGYLRNYANLNNIEVARKDLPNVYSALFGEYAFALLGYYYGYSVLKNTDERLSFKNPAISYFKLADKKVAIKFELKSEFERKVIDLVYHKVFGGKIGEIENLNGKFISENKETLQGGAFEASVQSSLLIDFEYLKISVNELKISEAQSQTEKSINYSQLLAPAPERIRHQSDLGALCQRLKMVPIFSPDPSVNIIALTPIELINRSYFDKGELFKRLEDIKCPLSKEEISLRIELAKITEEL